MVLFQGVEEGRSEAEVAFHELVLVLRPVDACEVEDEVAFCAETIKDGMRGGGEGPSEETARHTARRGGKGRGGGCVGGGGEGPSGETARHTARRGGKGRGRGGGGGSGGRQRFGVDIVLEDFINLQIGMRAVLARLYVLECPAEVLAYEALGTGN